MEIVRLARADYKGPDTAIIPQPISNQTRMQVFLNTNGPLIPVPPRVTIASQNNRITEEDQQTDTTLSFEIPLTAATNVLCYILGIVLGAVTAPPPPNN